MRRFAATIIAVPLVAAAPAGLCLPAATPPRGWRIEAESPCARVSVRAGTIDISTPAGLTLWSTQALTAPVVIRFEAMAVANGGPDDRVSDLNAFWMAANADGTSVLARRRSGAFADYDDMTAYYVGIGGNGNTTTRLRRYVGERGNRPILPEHDRSDPPVLLVPNRWTRIALIADGALIAVDRDGARLFTLIDAHPYRRGHWGLRTTFSHLRIRRVSVTRLRRREP